MKRPMPWSDQDEHDGSSSDASSSGFEADVKATRMPGIPRKRDGKYVRRRGTKEAEESYEERQKTRAAPMDGEQLTNVQTRKEKKNLSFSQKEKRKRDFVQARRGDNYVEEEKRLLRDSGVYSGFDR